MANNVDNYNLGIISIAAAAGSVLLSRNKMANNIVNNVANVGSAVFRTVQAHPYIAVIGVVSAGVYYMGWHTVIVDTGKDAVRGVINTMNNKRDSNAADRTVDQAKIETEKLKVETKENKDLQKDYANRTQKLVEFNEEDKTNRKEISLFANITENKIKKLEEDNK